MERHTYIIGSTGQGKSTVLKNKFLSAIEGGHGALFIDPHGFDTDDLLGRIPRHRRKDVILFDPSDHEHPIAWNPIGNVDTHDTPLVASTMVDTFKDVWGYANATTPTLDQYLYNTTVALIEANQSLLGMKFMLTSNTYRSRILKQITDPIVCDFWSRDFEQMSERDRRDTTRSTLNKIGTLLSDRRIRNIIGQKKSAFSASEIIDQKKIFFCRLPQGQLGLQKASLVGTLLLSQFHLAALRRSKSDPFFIYIDECHHFQGQTLIEMFSGIRKFGVYMTVAHQYLDQLSLQAQAAVLGNSDERYIFRVSLLDVRRLNDILRENQMMFDLHTLRPFECRLVAPEGMRNHRISFELPPHLSKTAEKIRAGTYRHYAGRSEDVDRYILRFIENT